MKKEVIIINAMREGYGIDQIKRTMTAGELIDFLSEFDEDALVYLSHDRGYTYGGITEDKMYEAVAEMETGEIIEEYC